MHTFLQSIMEDEMKAQSVTKAYEKRRRMNAIKYNRLKAPKPSLWQIEHPQAVNINYEHTTNMLAC
ncbi:rlmE [Acrasis kona]|uniref:RlmE n=1 Tax=Acrasis kona TaxID=1008807 RepID=A0AAW2ZNL8_9EUKA